MHRARGICCTSRPSIRAREATGRRAAFPSLAKAEFNSVLCMVHPPTSRRAVRPAAARARTVYAEAESRHAQDVQRPFGTCHLLSSSGTLSSMVLASFFQFGVESKLRFSRSESSIKSTLCGSALFVLGAPVYLARMPSRCLPRKNAPSNPSIEGTAKQLRCLPAPHVKR